MSEVVTFGQGDVAVSAGVQVPDMDTVVGMLFIEQGLGAGSVGASVPDRPAGKAVWPSKVNGVVLEFPNRASIDVVIEQLQDLHRQLTSALESADVRREFYDKGQAAIAA